MNFKRINFIYLSISFLILINFSCTKDPEVEQPNFSKGSLLSNLADNFILTSFNELESNFNSLESSFLSLQSNPTQSNLEDLRDNWRASYLTWQTVKIFDFGPLRELGFKGGAGTYPTDTNKVNENIINGNYNLGSLDNTEAIGFSALDYLLFRDNALIDIQNNNNYTQYIFDVIEKMKNEFMQVNSQWSSYKPVFVASTGTETTSGFSLLINEYNRDYELAKKAKLGIPLGVQSLGIPLLEYIEARYSGISLELLKESILALRNVYLGDVGSTTGQGFHDYLIHLERSNLASTIENTFNQILNKIDTFSGTLETEISNNSSELNELYDLIQGQVVNIKTDMTSTFGVLITYQDNDGD